MKLNKYIVSLSVLAIFGAVFAFSNIAFAQVPPTPVPVVTPPTVVPAIPPAPITTPIKLTSPNSGQFSPGQTVTIKWTGGDTSAPIRISLIKVSPFQTYTVITDTAPNTGSYTWTIPNNVPDNNYKFYVQSNRGKPGSTWSYGGTINISSCTPVMAPWIKVLTPNGGEIFTKGDSITVRWTSCNIPTSAVITIDITAKGDTPFSTFNTFYLPLNTTSSNDSMEIVTLNSNAQSGSLIYYFRIGAYDTLGGTYGVDYSDAPFSIK